MLTFPIAMTPIPIRRRRTARGSPGLEAAVRSALFAFVLLGPPAAGRLHAQGTGDEQLRLGILLGGTGFLGFVTEYQRNDWGVELVLGTITFHEVSVALSGKWYVSDPPVRPAVGLGLWSLTAWTEDGSGSILIARLPVSVDWGVGGRHALGVEVGLNRALAVNRLEPQDDTPPSRSIVPFPGFYYRHGWTP